MKPNPIYDALLAASPEACCECVKARTEARRRSEMLGSNPSPAELAAQQAEMRITMQARCAGAVIQQGVGISVNLCLSGWEPDKAASMTVLQSARPVADVVMISDRAS